MDRLTPRERWFWLGVGFGSAVIVVLALTIILIGMFYSLFAPAGEARPVVAGQPVAPAPPSSQVAPPAAQPAPVAPAQEGAPRGTEGSVAAPSSGGHTVPGAALTRAGEPWPQAARKQEPRPRVAVAERPRRVRRTVTTARRMASAGTDRDDRRGVRRAATRPRRQAPVRSKPAPKVRLATSREEWRPPSQLRASRPAASPERRRVPRRLLAQKPAAPHVERIAGEERPRPVVARQARYPTSAMVEGVTGATQLKVTVDRKGGVRRAVVVNSSGDLRLDAAALQAAKRWRYRPARRNGRPVGAVDHITFEFSRDGDR